MYIIAMLFIVDFHLDFARTSRCKSKTGLLTFYEEKFSFSVHFNSGRSKTKTAF